jgi:PKD repeat protein
VQFTDATFGGATAWTWNFGDGDTSTLQNPSHAYAAAGTYTVMMTATNACGAGSPAFTSVSIAAGPPAGGFSFSGSLCEGQPLQFVDESTGVSSTWLWDFGDGNVSREQ